MNDGVIQVETVCSWVVWDLVEVVLEVTFLLHGFPGQLSVFGSANGYEVWAGHGHEGLEVEVVFDRDPSHWVSRKSSCKLRYPILH